MVRIRLTYINQNLNYITFLKPIYLSIGAVSRAAATAATTTATAILFGVSCNSGCTLQSECSPTPLLLVFLLLLFKLLQHSLHHFVAVGHLTLHLHLHLHLLHLLHLHLHLHLTGKCLHHRCNGFCSCIGRIHGAGCFISCNR